MFDITVDPPGTLRISGRLDSAQSMRAQEVFDSVETPELVDFTGLEYISSAGLRVLLATQKRLREKGKSLKLANMSKPVKDIFLIAQFNQIFEII